MRTRLISLLIATLAGMTAVDAASVTGTLTPIPVFGEFTSLLDTGDYVWYVTGGRLNYYSRTADETRTFIPATDISDYTVKSLFYNYDKECLAVVYDNSNIDIIYDGGARVVNLPDVKDAPVSSDKTINDIAFHGDELYVATGFGLVRYDMNTHEVKESGIYNGHGIYAIGALDDGLVVTPSGYDTWATPLYFLPYGTPLYKYDNFRVIRANGGNRYYDYIPVGGNSVICLQNKKVVALKFNAACTDITAPNVYTSSNVDDIIQASDGGVYFVDANRTLFHATPEATLSAERYPLPAPIKSDLVTTYKGPEVSLFAAAENGIGEYRLSQDGSLTVLREKSVNEGATSFSGIARLYPGANGGFIISNLGQNQYHPVGTGDRHNVTLMADLFENGKFTPITADGITAVTSQGQNLLNSNGKKIPSPTWICQDPDILDRFYVASAVEGVYVIENGKQVGKFDRTNINKVQGWVDVVPFVTVDYQGNLWMTIFGNEANSVVMLPAEKRKNPANITADDWVFVDFGGTINSKDSRLLICQKSPVVLAFDSFVSYALEAIRHNGTLSDVSSFQKVGWARVTDTDGKAFAPAYWVCGVEDKNGQLWIGTSEGVVTIPNPNTLFSSDFAVNRVKVPRNDGTNLADYLLETDLVLCIAVDHSNRKWIGTQDSGLYLVSESGDEIIATYTSANSFLPTNTITGLFVDPTSNLLYVSTLAGLFVLDSDSSPAKPDFKEVYAYPNPITPDFSGWVTITGLMDNSLVKIVDAGMHLVYQTTSEGGMAMWDGCNLNGERVRSGVYYVIASSGNDTSSQGAVATKILVVN